MNYTQKCIKQCIICINIQLQYTSARDIMYASDKTKRRGTRHLVFRRDNEQTVCEADNEHEVRVCEFYSWRERVL